MTANKVDQKKTAGFTQSLEQTPGYAAGPDQTYGVPDEPQTISVAGFDLHDPHWIHALCLTPRNQKPQILPGSIRAFPIASALDRGLMGFQIVQSMLSPLLEDYLTKMQVVGIVLCSPLAELGANLHTRRAQEILLMTEVSHRRVSYTKAIGFAAQYPENGVASAWLPALGAALIGFRGGFIN